MNWNIGNIQGLIPLLGGIFGLMVAFEKTLGNPSNPKKYQQWQEKYSTILKIISPIAIILGLLQLMGIM